MPTGKRLERARFEHDRTLRLVEQAERNSRNFASASVGWVDSAHRARTPTHKSFSAEEIDKILAKRSETMHEREAKVAREWTQVEALIKVARGYY